MNIRIVRHVNKDEKNRIEFLLANFDYFDGNDLLAKLFNEEFQMTIGKKVDGIFFSVIKVYNDTTEYHLVWHEDVGNYIFSVQQDENSISELEQKLEIIVDTLNKMVKH